MNEESNKVSARRYFEDVWERGDLTVLRDLFVPGSLLANAAEMNVTMMRPAFSDIRASVDDLVAEGDMVAAHVTFTATNTGSLLGFPPTGKTAVMSALALFTFADDHIRTLLFIPDTFGLLVALGLIGPPNKPGE